MVGTIAQAFLRCRGDPEEMEFNYVAESILGIAALTHEGEKWGHPWNGAVQAILYQGPESTVYCTSMVSSAEDICNSASADLNPL